MVGNTDGYSENTQHCPQQIEIRIGEGGSYLEVAQRGDKGPQFTTCRDLGNDLPALPTSLSLGGFSDKSPVANVAGGHAQSQLLAHYTSSATLGNAAAARWLVGAELQPLMPKASPLVCEGPAAVRWSCLL